MVFIHIGEGAVGHEQVEMRVGHPRRRRVDVQAGLVRSAEMAVQQRYQQLRHHDEQQQGAPHG